MATSRPIQIQFSREDLHRRGVRDRLRNPPIVDDEFDNLLAKLQMDEREVRSEPTMRLPIFRKCPRKRAPSRHKS